jgi:hypothetical protein
MSARERSDCETVSYESPVTSRTPGRSLLHSAALGCDVTQQRCTIFCIVFCVRNAIFVHVLMKFSNYSYLFVSICKGDPVCFVVLRVSVCFLILWGGGFPIWFVLY